MSALSIQPTFPIFTETNGLPLENGYIWIGAANLDPQGNPINVYWDAALTIAAPQPIRTLGGYPSRSGTPARIYVNSDYSIRVMDKNGSLVYSAADGATDRFSSVQVSFLQAGTGATPRTAQDKMRETVSVKDFGAVGDGVTDDTAAIQATANTGASVFFPFGRYKVTAAITPAVAYQTFYGVGDATIVQGAVNINCFDLSGTEGGKIRNLVFEGAAATLGGSNFARNHAVYGDIVLNVAIENCRIYGFYVCGIQLRRQKNALIADNVIYGNWYGDSSASDITVYSALGSGINLIIRNNFCLSNNSQGIYVSAIGGDRDTIIQGNIVNTLNASWQEQTDYSTNMGTPPAVKFSNTLLYRRHGIVIGYDNDQEGKITVANNVIRNTMWTGVYRNASNQTIGTVSVTNNIISKVSLGAESNGLSAGINFIFSGNSCLISGNLITDVGSVTSGAKAAIQFAGVGSANSGLMITNNSIKNCGYGINSYTNAIRNLQILGNSFYDLSVQGIRLTYGRASEAEHCSAKIIGNHIEKFAGTSSQQAGIFLSFASVAPPIIAEVLDNNIDGNAVGGFGIVFLMNATGVNTDEQLIIRGNVIKAVVTAGIQSNAFADARMFNWSLGGNVFYDCPTAYNIGSQVNASRGFVVVDGGNFYNVTTKFGAFGGFSTLRFGKWASDRVAEVYDSALPTTGRWYQGDKVVYTNPAAGGSAGAICVTSGQFGTLSGVTANTTASSATITVNTATDLYVGMVITIAGVAGAKEIQSVSGTTVILTSTCDATTTGAAVANNIPVLKAYGAIDA
jgi:hypothetical protein